MDRGGRSPHRQLFVYGSNGDCQNALLRGNALQPVLQHLATSTCLNPRWLTSQHPQGSLLQGSLQAPTLQGSLQGLLAPRLSTRLSCSEALYKARSEALSRTAALRLFTRLALKISTRIVCSEALYRARSLRGSLQGSLAPRSETRKPLRGEVPRGGVVVTL